MKPFAVRAGIAKHQPAAETAILGRKSVSGSDVIFGEDYRFSGEDMNSIMETFADEFAEKLAEALVSNKKFQKTNTALGESRPQVLAEIDALSTFLDTEKNPTNLLSLEKVASSAIKKQFFSADAKRPIPETRRDVEEWIQRTKSYLQTPDAYAAEPSLSGLFSDHWATLPCLIDKVCYDFGKQIENEAITISGRAC